MLIALRSHLAMCRQFAVGAGDPPLPGVLMQLPKLQGVQWEIGSSRGFSDKLFGAFSVGAVAEGLFLLLARPRQSPIQAKC